MAAGLVSHNITTASGVTFAVVSWVPNTSTPDVGAVPVARITDGTNVALVNSAGQVSIDTELGQMLGTAVSGANPGALALVARADTPSIAHTTGTYSHLITDSSGRLWTAPLAAGTAHIGEVAIDPTQLGTLIASGVPVISGGYDWLWIDANQTNTTLPSTVIGSYLEHLMCMVETPTASQVLIKDGSGTARIILPDNVAGGKGTYILPIGVISKLGAWQITTNTGVTVIATFHV